MDTGKKKLLLIIPRRSAVTYDDFGDWMQSITGRKECLLVAAPATIAALTPPEFEVKIIDESLEPVDFSTPCDLIGITGFPYQRERAEQIARGFASRGVPVVCGGSSVTLSPEKWRPFADVLIIGEAERTWPRFLEDYLKGSFRKEYREKERPDLALTPVPDYRAYSPKHLSQYQAAIVQTSRGCPYNCEFCDAVVYMGRKTRYKPTETVLKEVDQIRRISPIRYILLADDNFSAHPRKAKQILTALKAWNQRLRRPFTFFTQLSIEIADDPEFLELAAETGMTRVFTGIETSDPRCLRECHKSPNLNRDLLQAVRNFHAYGIQVVSGCIVGFDHDDLSVFRRQFDFFMQSGIPMVRVAPLQVLDGTPLKTRMIREGRYCQTNGSRNELVNFSYIPARMTGTQLGQGIYWLLRQLYTPENYLIRFRTFFENYRQAGGKGRSIIPRSRTGIDEMAVGSRLGLYLLKKAIPAERTLFRKMLQCAGRSTHPRRFSILVENFLEYRNMQELLHKLDPAIQQAEYPTQQKQ